MREMATAEVYRQVAQLMRCRVPLAAGLGEVAAVMPRGRTREATESVAADLQAGVALGVALARHPGVFESTDVALIAAGERTDQLAVTLAEVAAGQVWRERLRRRARTALTYPVMVVLIAAATTFLLGRWVMPHFGRIYDEILGGEPLPRLTQWVLAVSDFTVSYDWPLGLLLVCGFILAVALALDTVISNRLLSGMLQFMPVFRSVLVALDYGRLAAVLAAALRSGVPLTEVLTALRPSVYSTHGRQALKRWLGSMATGRTLRESVLADRQVDSLFRLALEHCDEAALPASLTDLVGIYQQRAIAATRLAGAIWVALGFVAMLVVVAATIFAAFMPLSSCLFYI